MQKSNSPMTIPQLLKAFEKIEAKRQKEKQEKKKK